MERTVNELFRGKTRFRKTPAQSGQVPNLEKRDRIGLGGGFRNETGERRVRPRYGHRCLSGLYRSRRKRQKEQGNLLRTNRGSESGKQNRERSREFSDYGRSGRIRLLTHPNGTRFRDRTYLSPHGRHEAGSEGHPDGNHRKRRVG